MAIMSPVSINDIKDITLGEMAVFNYLKTVLPDNYSVWYDTLINNVNPDFVILGPELGVIVLEVKDWDIRGISKADVNEFRLQGFSKALQNPLVQARNYARRIMNLLEEHESLKQKTGKYTGKIKCNVGYIVIFSKILEEDFMKKDFKDAIPKQFLLFKDDLLTTDVTHLFKKLLQTSPFDYNFTNLEPQDVELIRSIISRDKVASPQNLKEAPKKTKNKTPFIVGSIAATICIIFIILFFKVFTVVKKQEMPPTVSKQTHETKEQMPIQADIQTQTKSETPKKAAIVPQQKPKIVPVQKAPTKQDDSTPQKTINTSLEAKQEKPIDKARIKGNINKKGEKIYHMPGQKYYDTTIPEEWFYTEEEAIKAGYRKSKI